MFEFLSNPVNILMILSGAALLIGIIGGNLEGKGVKIPPLTSGQRVGMMGLGLLLLGTGVIVHMKVAPQAANDAIAQKRSQLEEQEAAERALGDRIKQLEVERDRLAQTASQEQAARLAALERELAAKREQEAKVAAQAATTRAVLDQKEDALRASERVVGEYYAALNRLDFATARSLYQNPGPRLERAFSYIKQPDLFDVQDIKSERITSDARSVVVKADVHARGGKEHWAGSITVARDGDGWKIASIDLGKPLQVARQQ